MEIRQRLAKNLRKIRTDREWSQEELSFEVGIHRTYISDLERGARNPSIVVVGRLADKLNVSVGALLD